MSYLRSFPFDRIKIDRSFVKDIAQEAGSLNIVRAVTAMAAGLGMATTAEGVETREQLEMVREEGCTEMQGYFFSPPRPIKDIERLLQAEQATAERGVGSRRRGARRQLRSARQGEARNTGIWRVVLAW